MKKMFFLLVAVAGSQLASFSQNAKFVDIMKENLVQFDSAKTAEDFTKLANTFERIGDKDKTQWLPYYYAALALSNEGWMPEVKDKDANSEKINALCDKAEALAATDEDKSEIQVVRNMSATQQMMVNPTARWASYGKAASDAITKGLQENSKNPRLYYLQGMSLFNTPVKVGGGKDKAKPMFEKAVELYKTAEVKPMYPDWGKQQSVDMLAQCQ